MEDLTLGQRLRLARESADLTQEELGERAGLSGATIIAYEKGRRTPRADMLVRLADALDVSVGWLATGM